MRGKPMCCKIPGGIGSSEIEPGFPEGIVIVQKGKIAQTLLWLRKREYSITKIKDQRKGNAIGIWYKEN